MKLPKFLIAENPMAKSHREFVLHTQQPRMLIEVFDITGFTQKEEIELKKKFNVGGTTEVNGLYFLLTPAIYFENITTPTQNDADSLAGLMRRAADWWHAYIKFEDEKN